MHLRSRVKPGDAVKRGDVVALVETEKGVIEVEIFASGVIESLVVQPGQKVPVGATLATLTSDEQSVPGQVPAQVEAVQTVALFGAAAARRRLGVADNVGA